MLSIFSISEIGGVKLGREVAIFGFNHNLQSGRGMSIPVRNAMKERMGKSAQKLLVSTGPTERINLTGTS